jgi:hypothetical protein
MGGNVPCRYEVCDRKLVANEAEAASPDRFSSASSRRARLPCWLASSAGRGVRSNCGSVVCKGMLCRSLSNRVFIGEAVLRSPRMASTSCSARMVLPGWRASPARMRGLRREPSGAFDALGPRPVCRAEARGRKLVITPDGTSHCPLPRVDSVLAKAIARAHRWHCWRAVNAPASPNSPRPRKSTGPTSAACSG